MDDPKRARVLILADKYLDWCRRWEHRLARSPGMNDQIGRAASSLIANLGEAFDADTLGEKRRYFRYALASTGEGRKLVGGAARVGTLPSSAAGEGLKLLRDIKWDLIRLIRWTKR